MGIDLLGSKERFCRACCPWTKSRWRPTARSVADRGRWQENQQLPSWRWTDWSPFSWCGCDKRLSKPESCQPVRPWRQCNEERWGTIRRPRGICNFRSCRCSLHQRCSSRWSSWCSCHFRPRNGYRCTDSIQSKPWCRWEVTSDSSVRRCFQWQFNSVDTWHSSHSLAKMKAAHTKRQKRNWAIGGVRIKERTSEDWQQRLSAGDCRWRLIDKLLVVEYLQLESWRLDVLAHTDCAGPAFSRLPR